MPEPNKKQPTGAPELPDETKKLLDDQGDISAQKSKVPENLPEVLESGINDEDDAEVETPDAPDESPVTSEEKHGLRKFFAGFWRHKKWTLPLTLLVIVGVLLAIPVTRYPMLASFVSKTYSLEVLDSKNGTPVSGAVIQVDATIVTTDSRGRAQLHLKVGKHTISVDKKYYQSSTREIFIGLRSPRADTQIKLEATGRQVPITVLNKMSGKPVPNADIKVLDTSAKTDGQGKAIIVLPTKNPTETAQISATGFNQLTGKVHITDATVPGNTFSLVPAGRVYFLSNRSGTVDVVSTNYDGTARKTITTGTGNEDMSSRLFVSPDQKHLALYAKRDDSKAAKLYSIDASSGELSLMDAAVAEFTPYGWAGSNFVYLARSLTIRDWQPGQSSLKSFNATDGQAAKLDRNAAKGTQNDYISQNFGFVELVGNRVVYGLSWVTGDFSGQQNLSKQKDVVISANADGTDRRELKSVALSTADSYTYFNAVRPEPQKLYIRLGTGSGYTYYIYQDGNVTQTNSVGSDSFYKTRPTYYVSPDGQRTFWTENRDGQDVMFVGDASAGGAKQVAALDGFTPYGWNTNGFLLVSKGGSQLHVLPSSGLSGTKQPMKISDYYATPKGFGP